MRQERSGLQGDNKGQVEKDHAKGGRSAGEVNYSPVIFGLTSLLKPEMLSLDCWIPIPSNCPM